MKIVFVGSNPSRASIDETAFHKSTRSSEILYQWIRTIEGTKEFLNVSSIKTQNNRPLKLSEIKSSLPELARRLQEIRADHIVALGKTATKALTLLGERFFEMPHPSGMNRKLNDKVYMQQKIKELVEHCSATSSS